MARRALAVQQDPRAQVQVRRGGATAPSLSKLAIQYLQAEFARQGFPVEGPVLRRSVFSGKLADTAAKAWDEANAQRVAEGKPRLKRITLQECRHTYASMLMAARYTSIEIMVNMGHSDLKATEQYLKALPQPNELNEADRLHNYEDGFAQAPRTGQATPELRASSCSARSP